MTAPLRCQVGERVSVRLTYEDYCALPEDGRRYQLLEGDLDVTPPPSTLHQRVSRNLELVLAQHVKRLRLGALYHAPIDVILAEDTIVQPDIVFVVRPRMHIISQRGVEAPPDLVIEILSQKTRRVDRTAKMRLYARHGVREYWLVDPDAGTIEVLALQDGAFVTRVSAGPAETVRSELLPGLEVSAAEVFAED